MGEYCCAEVAASTPTIARASAAGTAQYRRRRPACRMRNWESSPSLVSTLPFSPGRLFQVGRDHSVTDPTADQRAPGIPVDISTQMPTGHYGNRAIIWHVRPDDFFTADRFSEGHARYADRQLLRAVRAGVVPERDDVEVAAALARLVNDELASFGTGGGEEMTNDDMRDALLALRAVVDRVGVEGFDPPFRDFTTFKTYWIRKGAAGSGGYQARRNLLADLFDSLHDALADLETHALAATLVEPVSTHSRTGWSAVDTEISELRRHFRSARTPQDYRAVGNDCVAVTEALGRQVYQPALHLRPGETEPPAANTKQRLERFVEDAVPGADNAAVRKLARAVIELSQQIKHSSAPTRLEAGICADAVIQLANMLRRLSDS